MLQGGVRPGSQIRPHALQGPVDPCRAPCDRISMGSPTAVARPGKRPTEDGPVECPNRPEVRHPLACQAPYMCLECPKHVANLAKKFRKPVGAPIAMSAIFCFRDGTTNAAVSACSLAQLLAGGVL